MKLAAALFDRDGVLVTTDLQRLARDVARLGVPQADLARRWRAWLGTAVLRDEADECDTIRDFLAEEARAPGLDQAARAALRAFDYAPYVAALPDAEAGLREVRQRGLRVGVLTNNSAELSPSRMLKIAGLGELVDVALSAQMLGAAKPDARAFHAAAAALDAPPPACLFFDDAEASVAAARAVGMRAYRVDRERAHDLARATVRDLSVMARVLDLENDR